MELLIKPHYKKDSFFIDTNKTFIESFRYDEAYNNTFCFNAGFDLFLMDEYDEDNGCYNREDLVATVKAQFFKTDYINTYDIDIKELADVISSCVPAKYKRLTHPARRTFQAIRIEVNKELSILPKALNDAIDMLKKGGVIAVITFHSLEDRICKEVFKERSKENEIFKGMPNVPEEYIPDIKVLKKIKPSKEELEENKRSRSATLRVAVKQK